MVLTVSGGSSIEGPWSLLPTESGILGGSGWIGGGFRQFCRTLRRFLEGKES